MTSLQNSIKQIPTDGGYFITLGNMEGKVYKYDETAKTFSDAVWAKVGAGASLSSISTSGGLLKDMGKTVVSTSRTFRKVQLSVKATPSTFGVGGTTTANEEYFTGYIELGIEGQGVPAPVAHFGR
jgi:hypothetical protein